MAVTIGLSSHLVWWLHAGHCLWALVVTNSPKQCDLCPVNERQSFSLSIHFMWYTKSFAPLFFQNLPYLYPSKQGGKTEKEVRFSFGQNEMRSAQIPNLRTKKWPKYILKVSSLKIFWHCDFHYFGEEYTSLNEWKLIMTYFCIWDCLNTILWSRVWVVLWLTNALFIHLCLIFWKSS